MTSILKVGGDVFGSEFNDGVCMPEMVELLKVV